MIKFSKCVKINGKIDFYKIVRQHKLPFELLKKILLPQNKTYCQLVCYGSIYVLACIYLISVCSAFVE